MLAHKCPETALCLLGLQLGRLGTLCVMAKKQTKHSHLVDGNCWRKRAKEMKGTGRKSVKHSCLRKAVQCAALGEESLLQT